MITDSSGTLVEKYEYGAYGNTTIKDATDVLITESAIGNPYGFTGRRLDNETGLYYYRARMYSPTLGRFLQTDPIGYLGGANLYAYVDNDPVNSVDPLGLYWQATFMTTQTSKELMKRHVSYYWKRLGEISDDLFTGARNIVVWYQQMKVITEIYKYTRIYIQHYVWVGDNPPCGKRYKQEVVRVEEWEEVKTKEIPGRTDLGTAEEYFDIEHGIFVPKVRFRPPS